MKPRSEQGVALVFVLIMLSVMTMIGLGITGIGMVAITVTTNASETANALAIADAGLSHAKKLILWQEWPSLDVLLQNGAGTACDGDELADPPAGAPAGYPVNAADFIPQAGRAFGGGTYQVFICDDEVNDVDPATGALNLVPNVDVNKRIIVRSIGVGANGATATVEQVFGSEDLPAVIVNGNVRVSGSPNINGAAGAIHGNGTLSVAGNACAQQYFSAVAEVPVTGSSAGGGAGCTTAGLETRPDSPPLNVPVIQPDMYKAQSDYWLESDGSCYNGATGAPLVCATLGWNFNAGSTTWSGGSSILPGTYWINGNVSMSGSPGTPLTPLPLTILARGFVDVTGSPRTTPDLIVPGFGANPVGLAIVAGTDIRLAGTSTQLFDAVYYAGHQIEVLGNPTINGQVLALNAADTVYPIGAGAGNNLVPLNAAGEMVISGNPTITFGGNGVQSVRARRWRECRTDADPANPCGPLFGS